MPDETTPSDPSFTMSVLRLTFPVQTVLAIIFTTLAVSGGVYASQYGLRSDLRDLATQMQMQRQIDEAGRALEAERMKTTNASMDALKAAMEAMQRRQELQQYEIQGMKEAVMGLRGER